MADSDWVEVAVELRVAVDEGVMLCVSDGVDVAEAD